ncbi:MAG: lysophospholipid acyltransferase family protein, partial [Myxococcales bacterium]
MNLAARIYSTFYWLLFVTACVVLFCGALLVFLVTYPFDRDRRILHLYSCAWAQLLFHVNPGWKMRVENRDRLPWRGPAVIVSNHQSLGDILILFGLYRPFKWVSKASVFKVPFLGWNMRMNGYVGLIRGNKDSIIRMMADCERWLDRGVPVLIFPEGTRSPDKEVKEFKDGAFRLAIKKNVPVIPIAITGSADTLPKHGLVVQLKSNCVVRVLEPVNPALFDGDVAGLR